VHGDVVVEGRWNMIYGTAQQQQQQQQRWSWRSLLYTKVIPRSQRCPANESRDDNNATHAQPTTTQQDFRPPVTSREFLPRDAL